MKNKWARIEENLDEEKTETDYRDLIPPFTFMFISLTILIVVSYL
jgi:hypothetical protein